MRLSAVVLTGLLGSALAHDENLSPAELQRRSALSSRCEANAASFNKKRYERRTSKRWAGSGNTTYQIHTEAPYYETIQNDTCVLSPIVTEGPYVWPRSETLRQDMTEDQEGVPVWLDIGVLNMATCEPLEDLLLSFWHCNATGSYSSFTGLDPNTDFVELLSELGRNVSDFEIGVTDLHTDDTTWLRGMWPTDAHGMMEMKTIFPGFYTGRAIHIHVQAYTDWTLHENGTVSAGNIVSTGQLFFNETVSAQIMSLEPYASHTQINRTMNSVDSIFSYDGGYSPVVSVVPADGVDIRNGMIGYITIGVDTTAHGVDNSQ
ncbi:hypothetical protein G7054_g1898 [Neopestalotiopsis clavispora]|nr:hypothetical protein G7054_g1898 [Neopestalotiopsis clavispora]